MTDGDFTKIPNTIRDDKGLSLGAFKLYVVLKGLAYNRSSCNPTHNKLSEMMGLSRRRIIELEMELREKNYISATHSPTGKANTYQFPDVLYTAQHKSNDVHHKTHQHAQKCTPPCSKVHTSNNIKEEVFKEVLEEDHILSGKPDDIPYSEIISDLNQKAKTHYRVSTPLTRNLIKTRWKEGFRLEDFKTVHRKKCIDWKDGEYSMYKRPVTLYGTKFEGYLNQTADSKGNPFTEPLDPAEIDRLHCEQKKQKDAEQRQIEEQDAKDAGERSELEKRWEDLSGSEREAITAKVAKDPFAQVFIKNSKPGHEALLHNLELEILNKDAL